MVLVLVAALVGCGRAPSADGRSSGSPPETKAAPAPAGDSLRASAPRTEPRGLDVVPASAGDILAGVGKSEARVVVVNVWATWCGPCREEFPDLMKVYETYRDRGMELVLVSADFDDQVPEVRKFLAAHHVDFPTYIKTGDDMAFINALSPRWTGALPATFIYDGQGKLRHFHEGKASYSYFEQHVLDVLGPRARIPNPEESS
jgi:thiol-disulfide isomerase/thioredoxin